MSITIEYIPKGGMCASCKKKLDNCCELDFSSMYKIKELVPDGIVIVRCNKFERNNDE